MNTLTTEYTALFGLIQAPIDNLFILGFVVGFASLASLILLNQLINKYTTWFDKHF